MKKYFALAAVATMFAACTNEEVTQAESLKDTPITIASAGVGELTASRTTTDDVVNRPFGLFVESKSDDTKYEATNMKWTNNNGWKSDETLLFEGAGKQTAYAYHPYAENVTADYTFTTNGTTDLLWWKSGDALTGNSLSIEFAHALSKLTVNLKKNSEIGTADLGDVTIGGTILTGTANLAEQTWTLDENATASNISTTGITATTSFDKTVEVLLLPQTAAFSVVIEVDEKTYIWTSTGQTFAPGTAYTLNLNVGKDVTSVAEVRVADWGEVQNIEGGMAEEVILLSELTSTYVINDNETHKFYGSGNYGIKVESGSPTIILSDANISLNAGGQFSNAVNAIDIVATNSTTTIRVEGTDNNITAQYGAGIFVAQGSKVEITSSDQSNVLRVTGKGSSSAIGGYASSYSSNGVNCGDISINKVTLYATSDYNTGYGVVSPAIGGSGNAACGTIEVNDATIYAYGGYCTDTTNTPAIGLGQTIAGQTNNTIPTIKIIDSQIYAYRGGTWADYIGKPQSGVSTSLNLGSDGSAKNSTIYCYTGEEDVDADKVVQYDANGNVVED